MNAPMVLVVEDEEDIAELLQYNLKKEGFHVLWACTGERALNYLQTAQIDLVLLDLMLPDMNGVEICQYIRQHQKFHSVPIIMLTAKGEESDIVTGLEKGADDYVTKPFSPRVLCARVKRIMARQLDRVMETEFLKQGPLSIDLGRHQVLLNDSQIDLSPTEFQILHLLAGKAGWVFTRSQIVDTINGEHHAVTNRSVDVQIVGIRKKLGEFGHYIETVRGVGYRFKEVQL